MATPGDRLRQLSQDSDPDQDHPTPGDALRDLMRPEDPEAERLDLEALREAEQAGARATTDVPPQGPPEEPEDEGPGFIEQISQLVDIAPEGFRTFVDALNLVAQPEQLTIAMSEGEDPEKDLAERRLGAGRVVGAGAFQSAVNPILGALDLPKAVAHELRPDKVATTTWGFTDARREDLQEFAIHNAREAVQAGLDPEEAMGGLIAGSFLGYGVPIWGSFKAANAIWRARAGVTSGHILRDATAGFMLGSMAEPGDLEERLERGAFEAGVDVGVTVPLSTIGRMVKAYRMNRFVSKVQDAVVEGRIRKVQERYDPASGKMEFEVEDGQTARGMMEVLSEEEAVSESGEALQYMARQAPDERALVHALEESSRGEATHGIIRGVAEGEGMDVLGKLQEEFPDMNFHPVKRDGRTEILYGSDEIPKSRIKQYKREGRTRGQRVMLGGTQYEYLGRVEKPSNRVRLKELETGRAFTVREDLVRDLPYINRGRPGSEAWARAGEFVEEYETKLDEMASARREQTQRDWVQGIVRGEQEIDIIGKRETPRDLGPKTPQELGLGPDGGPGPQSRLRLMRAQGPQFEGEAQAFSVVDPEARRPIGVLRLSQEPQGGVASVQYTQLRGGQPFDQIPEGKRQIMLQDLMRNFDGIEEIRMGGEVVARSDRRALQAGEEGIYKQDPIGDFSFERLADNWARRQGLEGAEKAKFKAAASAQVRRELWKKLPDEQKQLIRQLRDRNREILETQGPQLDVMAAQAGFTVRRPPDGKVHLIEGNSGLRFIVPDEDAAMTAIQGAQRPISRFGEMGLMPSFADAVGPLGKQYGEPDSFILGALKRDLDPDEVTQTLSGRPRMSSIREWSRRVEDETGIPVFTEIVDPLIRATEEEQEFLGPMMRRWQKIWEPLDQKQAVEVGRVWMQMEGKQLSRAQKIGMGQRAGLDKTQIKTMLRAQQFERTLFDMTDLGPERYLENHLMHIKPMADEADAVDPSRVSGDRPFPDVFEATFEKARTGELAAKEADPRVIQAKYIRELSYKKHLKDPWERAAGALGSKDNPFLLNDAHPAMKERAENVLPVKEAQETFEEFLAKFHGAEAAIDQTVKSSLGEFFSQLGVNVSEEAVESLSRTSLNIMYGSTMALRPRMVTRNSIQNFMTTYTMIGAKHYDEAIKRTMSREGFQEAVEASAVRRQEKGVFAGQDIQSAGPMDEIPDGDFKRAHQSWMRRALEYAEEKTGRFTSRGMSPFGRMDDMNRVIAYHWKKLHVEEYLNKLEAGEISVRQFYEDGLPFASRTQMEKFSELYNTVGREEALRTAGRWNAEETQVVYSKSFNAPWMDSKIGKHFGAFTSFPMWIKDLFYRRGKNAGMKNWAKMAARATASMGAIKLAANSLEADLDNWMAPINWVTYTGPPAADLAHQMIGVAKEVGFNNARAAAKAQRMVGELGRIAVPGQGIYRDLGQSLEIPHDDPLKIWGSLMMGRPERMGYNAFFREQLAPGTEDAPLFRNPELKQETWNRLRQGVPRQEEVQGDGDDLRELIEGPDSEQTQSQPQARSDSRTERLSHISDLVQRTVRGDIDTSTAMGMLDSQRDRTLFRQSLDRVSDRQRQLLQTQDQDQ